MTQTWVSVIASFLHLVAVAVYVGGSVAMEFVMSPAQKYVPPSQAQVIGQKSADRFLILVWSALALFPISGGLLFFSLSDQNVVNGTKFFTTDYGRTLFAMIFLWFVLVINGSLITFVYRPKLRQKVSSQRQGQDFSRTQKEMQKAAQIVSWITRIDLVIAVFIVLLGASMAYGSGLL